MIAWLYIKFGSVTIQRSGMEIIEEQILPHFEGGYNSEAGNTHAVEVEVTQHGPKTAISKAEKRQRGFITILARKKETVN